MDRSIFDRLILEHLSAALGLATRLCGNPSAGEDLLHDPIVRAVRASDTLRDSSRFRSWFCRIVVNAFRDRHRREGPALKYADDDEWIDRSGRPPSAAASDREIAAQIAGCVSTLSDRQREVIVLVVYENLSSAEVAEILEISDQNVRTTLHLAREKLRVQLGALWQGARRD